MLVARATILETRATTYPPKENLHMRHKPCVDPNKPNSGRAAQWWIREHAYTFYVCDDCNATLGGEKVRLRVAELMATPLYPTMRRV